MGASGLRGAQPALHASEASFERAQGEVALLRDTHRLLQRARALDPTMDDTATVEEAISVLNKHGVSLGISEEVLEMPLTVPYLETEREED